MSMEDTDKRDAMAKAARDKIAKAVAKKLHSLEGTSRVWSLKFEGAGEGWAHASMVVREDMLNGHGTAHGGMIFALADTAFAWACNSRNVKTFAQHASISFLSAGREGERLTARAQEETAEGRTGVYTVRVTGDDGRVVAIFQGLSRTAGGAVIDETERQEE